MKRGMEQIEVFTSETHVVIQQHDNGGESQLIVIAPDQIQIVIDWLLEGAAEIKCAPKPTLRDQRPPAKRKVGPGKERSANVKTDISLMKVPEAARALGVTQKTVWDWIYSRKLSSTLIGRSRRIPAQAVKDLVERGMVSAVEDVAINIPFEEQEGKSL